MKNENVDIKQLGVVGRTKEKILEELKAMLPTRLFGAVVVWTAAFIVPPDRGCLQSAVRCMAARQATQKSQRDTTCPANM